MDKVREFVKTHGGTGAVARELGVTPSVVSTWINRGAIPLKQWKPLIERVGATWEELSELHRSFMGKTKVEAE